MIEFNSVAVSKAAEPLAKEFTEAWSKVGNEIGIAADKRFTADFPDAHEQVVSSALMSALPRFIHSCCMSVNRANQLQLAVLVCTDILQNAMIVEGARQQEKRSSGVSIEELIAALGGSNGSETNGDDRDTA